MLLITIHVLQCVRIGQQKQCMFLSLTKIKILQLLTHTVNYYYNVCLIINL